MSDKTSIEWTRGDDGTPGSTWNPVTGCTKVSPGCDHCYAESIAHRFAETAAYPNGFDVTLRPERLDQPLRWTRPRKIFVNSMSDLFHANIPDEYIARVWQTMGAAPQHTYQILTKRHGRMRSWVTRWYAGEIAEPERWADVPRFPGYSVSTTGIVRGRRSDSAAGMKLDAGEQGHLRVRLHRDGSPRSGEAALVHRLVMETFVRKGRPGEQVRHLNGDAGDNRLSNLRWGTQEDNWRDRLNQGNGRSYSKLTEADVAEIRIRHSAAGERALLDCVWLGVSAEDQRWANVRIPVLLDTPAAVRFVSAEPLLGPVDFDWLDGISSLSPDWVGGPGGGTGSPHPLLDWVIVGGESGPGARPMDADWARQIRDQCEEAEVAFLFKQWGSHNSDGKRVSKKAAGRVLDGVTWDQYPNT